MFSKQGQGKNKQMFVVSKIPDSTPLNSAILYLWRLEELKREQVASFRWILYKALKYNIL